MLITIRVGPVWIVIRYFLFEKQAFNWLLLKVNRYINSVLFASSLTLLWVEIKKFRAKYNLNSGCKLNHLTSWPPVTLAIGLGWGLWGDGQGGGLGGLIVASTKKR